MTEREFFAAYGVTWWHCSGLRREGARRTPCKSRASRIWIRPDGVRIGLCPEHRDNLDNEARLKGWRPGLEEPEEVGAIRTPVHTVIRTLVHNDGERVA